MRDGVVVVVILLCAVGAYSDTVEVNLFDLGCPTNLSSWTTEFDMGVTFSQISNVYIDWSGQMTAGLAVSNNNPNNPFPMDIGIIAYLGDNPWPRALKYREGKEPIPHQKYLIKYRLYLFFRVPVGPIYLMVKEQYIFIARDSMVREWIGIMQIPV